MLGGVGKEKTTNKASSASSQRKPVSRNTEQKEGRILKTPVPMSRLKVERENNIAEALENFKGKKSFLLEDLRAGGPKF